MERARAIFERYVEILPSVKAWVRYAKFEMGQSNVAGARSCYERALEALGEDAHTVRRAEGGVGSRGWRRGGRRDDVRRWGRTCMR